MKAESRQLLEKAVRALHAAQRHVPEEDATAEHFSRRIAAGYGLEVTISAEEAATLIGRAREFLAELRRYLGTGPRPAAS